MASKGTGSPYLRQLERSWYATRVASIGTTPLNQLQRTYWEKQLGSVFSKHGMSELEENWLKSVITANGQTPSNTPYVGTLWSEAVSSLGVIPSKYINENKILFYSTVAT